MIRLSLSARFAGVFVLALLMSSQAHAQAVNGVFKVVKGDVQVIQAADGQTVQAKIGAKVFPKDTIVAGKDSRAKIVMVDNNEINISPDTRLEIKAYEFKAGEDKKNVLLDVMYGKVRAKVSQHYEGDNKFQVKTPSAVAGVRGTDFITGYDPSTKASSVITFTGKVAFGQPGANGQINNAVFVGAGQMSGSNGSKAPSAPTHVPKSDLAKMDQQSDASTGSRQPADAGKSNGNGGGKNKDGSAANGGANNSNNNNSGNSANAGANSANNGAGPTSGTPDTSRAPASAPPTMINVGDLPSAPQGGGPGPAPLQTFNPPPPPPPPPPQVVPVNICQINPALCQHTSKTVGVSVNVPNK